jgi:cellobiose transport system substrate-binding protein
MHLGSRKRLQLASTVMAASVALVGLAGCSSSDDSASSSGENDTSSSKPCGTDKDTTVTVGLFGTFGFKENGLYDQYKKVCPNITIKEDVVTLSADYWTRLKTRLASGSGLDDVQAIEIGFVADVVKNHPKQFVNFNTVAGADAIKSAFYDWKWKQATTVDGKTTVGLGTDIGPEAMCYRSDLLKKAGLTTDPKQLASKWSTWQDFIDFGKQYKAKTGKAFVDSGASIFSTAVYQGKEAYADAEGNPDVEGSDGVKNAWSYATQAADAGITAGLSQFSDPWNKAFSSGSFAALACPTWMMGYIQGQAGPDNAGKWSIAPVLPGGATNWGGSWLGVPTAAKNKAAGVALVKWLSDKQQQVTMWTSKKQGGHFPSNQQAAEDPAVAKATSAYFSNAPVGQIFNGIAGQMKIPPIGLYDTQIQNAFTTQLTNVETRGTSPDKAFGSAVDAIKQVTG